MKLKLVLLFLTVPLLGISLSGCERDSTEIKINTPVTLGVAQQPSSGLIFIAQKKGFFKEQGLDVEFKVFPSGKVAMNDCLLTSACDFVSTSEVPFIFNSLKNKNLVTYASIYSSTNLNRLVVRTDRGIHTLQDLAGHTIGTQRYSAVHFFMHSVLGSSEKLHGQVIRKFMPANDLVNALMTGEIDAFSMREPYVSQALALMPGQTKSLAFPGIYIQYDLLVGGKPSDLTPKQVTGLLKGLIKAVKFLRLNPEESLSILAQSLDMSTIDLMPYWRLADFNVGLEHALLITLEQELNWLKEDGYINTDTVFNSLGLINSSYLLEIRPQAVMLME